MWTIIRHISRPEFEVSWTKTNSPCGSPGSDINFAIKERKTQNQKFRIKHNLARVFSVLFKHIYIIFYYPFLEKLFIWLYTFVHIFGMGGKILTTLRIKLILTLEHSLNLICCLFLLKFLFLHYAISSKFHLLFFS